MEGSATQEKSNEGARHVRGVLFLDYVRVVKRLRAGRSEQLEAEDLPYLVEPIDVMAWYPMATFERFGLAILEHLPAAEPAPIRQFGRAQLPGILAQFPTLLVPHQPRDTLMRFRVLLSSFFAFPAIEVLSLDDSSAELTLQYGMCAAAERAAAWQTFGFFEALLELSGAAHHHGEFLVRSWETPGRTTRLRLRWVDAPRRSDAG
jgi:hypothetical protein